MKHRHPIRRSGFVLLVVMALLAIVTVLIAGWARMAALENRQTHSVEDRQQADWLAESALQRAGAQLIANRDYAGETWTVSAADLGREAGAAGPVGGAVVIGVEPVADRPSARRVRVAADFPAATAGGAAGNRVTRQLVFDLAESNHPQAATR